MKTTSGSRKRSLALVAASVALLAVTPARAQSAPSSPEPSAPETPAPAASTPAPAAKREPTAGDLATARTALREGLALREKGELEPALARLASAYDLVPTPVTGFELGKTHMMLGHVLQAHELFKKVIRMPPSMEESTRSEVSREEAARLAKELEPRIPTLRLKISLPPGASAVVKIDDEEIPLTGAETTRAVDPGPHEIIAKAGDGPEETVLVDVAETEIKEVALAPTWVPPKNPVPGKTREVIFVRQTNPLAFVGFGVAAAALVVTTVSALIYIDARDDAKDKCGEKFCPPSLRNSGVIGANSVIDTSFQGENARYQLSGIVMVASGFTTLVFAGLGIFGAARPVKERVTTSVTVEPTVGLGRLGLTGTF
ncbi:MAG: hypothetical protein BGO98_08935 [Myxococcales bacterium 68-20]|nr:hypothetical protein [Myxococcales bacterium]OJY25114.1 MAG: hypothetical protein BGO98_08935 [Myxococcales bacterium 68-20]